METKDRIRSIMEDLKKTQQEFADFLEQSPATLSSIFNGRTRPSLNVVDAIKAKIPDISVEWLLYGTGEKYISYPNSASDDYSENQVASGQDLVLQFDAPLADANGAKNASSDVASHPGVRPSHSEMPVDTVRVIEKEPRRVTEIRVYYDDQTYETFLPAKK